MHTLTETHNLIGETKFHLKSFLLVVKRQFQNTIHRLPKFYDRQLLKDEAIISFSESDLWNKDDNAENWILTAGKIENLRIAVKNLNGIEVSANQVFSFWKHIGNPNLGKGYVVGREIREGCIIPTIAGGLCQLSNALYDAALKANFEIIERHKHTKVIKGSLAEQDRDATVKWNYVDLRFRSNHAFRIETEISFDKLIVKFKSSAKSTLPANIQSNTLLQSSKLNDCYSCGNFACFKHPDRTSVKQERAITTFILDEKWPEYDDYIKTVSTAKDFFIIPASKSKFFNADRFNWSISNTKNIRTTSFAAIQRAISLRLFSKLNKNIFSAMLELDKKVADKAAAHIPAECTHVVVSQNLLPWVWATGALGGRTFDVLMTRLPMQKLHERLDLAHAKYPDSLTLNDFRAPQSLIDLENAALTKSRSIITPHQEIADIFIHKSVRLNWHLPNTPEKIVTPGNKILFPASAVGRKGAYEMKRLAKDLNLSIVISGKAEEDKNFWDGVNIEVAGANPFDNICLVVYPTYVEHQPRLLLKALAAGLPVITTTASGLAAASNLTTISIGDYDELRRVVEQQLVKSTSVAYSW